MSLYWQDYQKLIEETAGKFSAEDELMIWQRVLRENIFVVAKTPMSAQITKRTLIGYRQEMAEDLNIQFVDNIVPDTKKSVKDEAEKIKGLFNLMKFDVVIGNPPYQDETKGDNDTFRAPIYNDFMDLSIELSNLVTLITPARFLFDAGSTPKAWNKKMLKDPHFKVIEYVANSSDVFPNTDIKGGVAVSLYDKNKNFGSIEEKNRPAGIFVPFKILVDIMDKVYNSNFESIQSIVYSAEDYRFTEKMHEDYPEIRGKLSKGHDYDIKSNTLEKLPEIFHKDEPNDGHKYVKMLGLHKKDRVYRYIREEYITNNTNLENYKVFIPAANGSGSLGESLSTPMIGTPMIGSSYTFMSIGNFKDEFEANAALKYVKSKFARVLLGILKITQHNPVATWKVVPLQDFTSNSDIDWTKSISEIDQQLYKKYGLSDEEINFIETKVQEMD